MAVWILSAWASSAASVNSYKIHQKPLDHVGRELGVQYVLEGSVQRDSGSVRITAQLVQVKDQTQIWARQYDRQLKNLLALQGEITNDIAGQIDQILDRHLRAGSVVNPVSANESYEAYDLYLRGRYEWNKRTRDGFNAAIKYFQQAIAKDPSYARAYAGLADSYALTSNYSFGPQRELMPKARAAAVRALELDERLAEAHTSLGLIAEFYDWDWPAAEKEFRRAIELNPNYATAHQWYAECLAFQGKFPQALAESGRARQLDPLSLIIAADYGVILYFSRQYDRAISVFNGVLAIDPTLGRAQMVIFPYMEKGEFASALAQIEPWRRLEPDSPWPWGLEAVIYGRWGRPEQARRALVKMQEANRRAKLDLSALLLTAYAAMGDKDRALALLQKGISQHANLEIRFKVDPIFDPLRSDPRFQEILRRLRLN